MGEAKRRRKAIEQARDQVRIAPRKRATGHVLVHHNRIESQGDDGMVYARNVFAVLNPETGEAFMEDTPNGPMPVLLMSVPQPVRRAVIATPALVR